MNIPAIDISDYNYTLPDEYIARFPLEKRDQSRLLISENDKLTSGNFTQLADYIPQGAV